MMTDEELQEAREYAVCQEYDCPSEDIIKRLLLHIDELTSQIATLKTALIQERANKLSSNGKAFHDYTIDAATQLAKEYPEIFAEEKE